MNQFNALHGDDQTEPPFKWNIQPPAVHFKSLNSDPKKSPVVSAIIWRLNHHAVDNVDVEVYPLYYSSEYTSAYLPDPNNTPIKSIGY